MLSPAVPPKKKLTFADITPGPESGLSLFPYQREGVKFLLRKKGYRSLLGDEPGVGKTPQVIVVANAVSPTYTIILCPSVVKGVWRVHWNAWTTLKNKLSVVDSSKEILSTSASVFIVSYDVAKKPQMLKQLKKLLSKPNTLLIADEAHRCKGYKTQRAALLSELHKAASRVLLVTGTPMSKSVGDLYPLVKICEGGRIESFHDFCYQYSFAYPTPFGSGLEYRGVRNIRRLRFRLAQFMIRRYKKDVLPQLPKKIYSTIPLDIGRAREEFTLSIQQITAILDGTVSVESENYPALRKALGVTKLPMVLEWLDYFYEENREETPLIVYGHHKTTIEGLREYFSKRQTAFGTITGATPSGLRTRLVESFQSGKLRVLLCNTLSGGIGVTLTRAHHCVFVELDWTPANISQAIDRLHRIGQEHPVNVYFLVAANTLEEEMLEMLLIKLKDIDKVMGKR